MTSYKQPASIRIFLADGTPEGLKIIEVSNWIGKAIMVSRSQFQKVRDRIEFSRPGIYVLLGKDDSAQFSSIYVGEGDPVLPRLDSHVRTKEFWTHLVVIVSKDPNLNKAHIQYLECKLLQFATEIKRVSIENGNVPTAPSLSESEEAEMEAFLKNMLLIYGTLGITAFEGPTQAIESSSTLGTGVDLFLKNSSGANARGRDTPEGFLVFKGSLASTTEAPSLREANRRQKEQLLQKGVLQATPNGILLTQDYLFTSPSAASSLFLGRPSSGLADWKTADGKSLKTIQANE